MSVTITKDRTAEVFRTIATLAKREVLVGIPQEAASRPGSPINNAEILYINDLGSPINNIPARPVLVPGVQHSEELWVKQLGMAGKSALSGNAEAAEKHLASAGQVAANAVKREFTDGDLAPNAPSTIAAKGSSQPLVDLGEARRAITYIIRNK
jgi:hypothetical protein